MEHQIKSVFQVVSLALEIFGGSVIVISAIYSAYRYLTNFIESVANPVSTDNIRIRLGKSLSFSLEFLIGADILRTLITPTLNEISILASTIAIRITLNFFLEREMEHLLKRGVAKS